MNPTLENRNIIGDFITFLYQSEVIDGSMHEMHGEYDVMFMDRLLEKYWRDDESKDD